MIARRNGTRTKVARQEADGYALNVIVKEGKDTTRHTEKSKIRNQGLGTRPTGNITTG